MDNSVYQTNSFYWDTKGNDFLGAIVLPSYGAFVAGFVIEQLIEESDEAMMQLRDDRSDLVKKAKMLPVTFVIKARKL
jgi:hypothetical protein